MRVIQRLALVLAATIAVGGLAAGTAEAAPGVPNIGPGSTNTQGVKCVQQAYNYVAGTHLTVDGKYGQLTYDATKNFQRFFKLQVDGWVGPQTGGMIAFTVNAKAGYDAWRAGGCYFVVPG